MMDALGRYLLSVSAAALITGIVLGFVKDSAHQKALKLVCGMFLLLTVIRPMAQVPLTGLTRFSLPYREEASGISALGEAYALDQLQLLIKQETQAYILDKASSLGVEVQVIVTVSNDSIPQPVAVEIRGAVSSQTKEALEQIIISDLNIAKENQLWTG